LGKYCSDHNQGLYANVLGPQARFSSTQKLFSNFYFENKILLFQNQTHLPPEKRDCYLSKRHEKYAKISEISQVAFIGCLYETHVVMCSNLVEVHAKKVDWT